MLYLTLKLGSKKSFPELNFTLTAHTQKLYIGDTKMCVCRRWLNLRLNDFKPTPWWTKFGTRFLTPRDTPPNRGFEVGVASLGQLF